MRMSCNGCRVLRKGCSESCSIRPCLQWIKNPESQANATVFLAKFYGRAGLMNLINAGPDHLRPAIFRSLLYEACGRIVNPIYGSVGLLWSGSWQLCQAAVEAVLKGAPIMQIATEAAANAPGPLLNKASSFDIRHVTRDYEPSRGAADLHRVNKATRPRFKRPGARHAAAQAAPRPGSPDHAEPAADPDASLPWPQYCPDDFHREGSDASSTSHPSAPGEAAAGESRENGSVFSGETAEGSMVTSHGAEAAKPDGREAAEDGEVELELTLGLEPAHHHHHHSPRSSSSSSSHSPARGGAAPAPPGGAARSAP